MAMRNSIFLNNQNTMVTAGLICAPLTLPIGEIAIDAPMDPNRKPVIARRTFISGMRCAMGLSDPNIIMTTDSPTDNNRAVPANSDKYRRQDKGNLLFIFIKHDKLPVYKAYIRHISESDFGELDNNLDVIRVSIECNYKIFRFLAPCNEFGKPLAVCLG